MSQAKVTEITLPNSITMLDILPLNKTSFYYLFVCVYACTNAHIHADAHRGQKEVVGLLELELQAAANY